MTAAQLETTVNTLHFTNAGGLIRAISNGLLFASTEGHLPMICSIKFEFDGTRLELLSTDRYQACIEVVEHKPDDPENTPAAEPFEFLLPRDAAKAVLGLLKANKPCPIQLDFDPSASIVRIRTYESSAEYRTIDNQFPPLRALYPDTADKVEIDEIGFNPKFLVNLGKVQTGRKVDTIRISLFGKKKPVVIEFDEGPRVLIMPTKLAG